MRHGRRTRHVLRRRSPKSRSALSREADLNSTRPASRRPSRLTPRATHVARLYRPSCRRRQKRTPPTSVATTETPIAMHSPITMGSSPAPTAARACGPSVSRRRTSSGRGPRSERHSRGPDRESARAPRHCSAIGPPPATWRWLSGSLRVRSPVRPRVVQRFRRMTAPIPHPARGLWSRLVNRSDTAFPTSMILPRFRRRVALRIPSRFHESSACVTQKRSSLTAKSIVLTATGGRRTCLRPRDDP